MRTIRLRLLGALGALTCCALLCAPGAGAAPATKASRPKLGSSDPYALIADQSIDSAGTTVVNGDVAVAGSTALSGFPPGIIHGETHLADQEALDAAGHTASVNQNLKSQPCNSDRSGHDLGGERLGTAVYCYIEPAVLDGTLRLDALGHSDAVFVFQINGTLSITPGSTVLLVNGAQACNVFWEITGPTSIGAGATVAGTFVTDSDIVVDSNARLTGRAFAPQGSITLDSATVTESPCSSTSGQVTTTTTTPTTTSTTVGSTTTSTPPTTEGTPATTPTTASGTGSATGSGTGTGDDGGTGGLAFTGRTSVPLAAFAVSAFGLGYGLVATERAADRRRRRWRPRHAATKSRRLF